MIKTAKTNNTSNSSKTEHIIKLILGHDSFRIRWKVH